MPKVQGPLFSLSASKLFGKTLEYRDNQGINVVSKKHQPGDIGNANFSISVINNRLYTAEAVSKWQSLSDNQKKLWNDFINN